MHFATRPAHKSGRSTEAARLCARELKHQRAVVQIEKQEGVPSGLQGTRRRAVALRCRLQAGVCPCWAAQVRCAAGRHLNLSLPAAALKRRCRLTYALIS